MPCWGGVRSVCSKASPSIVWGSGICATAGEAGPSAALRDDKSFVAMTELCGAVMWPATGTVVVGWRPAKRSN